MKILNDISAFGHCKVASDMLVNESYKCPSMWEVTAHVDICEDSITTYFRVYPRTCANWNECLYETFSFKDLKQWLETHKEEIK